jgi:hypothetical protein
MEDRLNTMRTWLDGIEGEVQQLQARVGAVQARTAALNGQEPHGVGGEEGGGGGGDLAVPAPFVLHEPQLYVCVHAVGVEYRASPNIDDRVPPDVANRHQPIRSRHCDGHPDRRRWQ